MLYIQSRGLNKMIKRVECNIFWSVVIISICHLSRLTNIEILAIPRLPLQLFGIYLACRAFSIAYEDD